MIKTLALLLTAAAPATAQVITAAEFSQPTTRYGHAILGDAIEYGGLILTLDDGSGTPRAVEITLPQDHVFEDVAPRLWDVTGDGAPEVVVVETDVTAGGALAIYGPDGKITETPHIGRANRWLAPIGAADLDGDGHIEIAYVDRPHLARVLRVLRFQDGALHDVTQAAGVTNHRIGEADIAGGIRDCGTGPEMIVATANWTRLLAVRLRDGDLSATDIGPHRDRASFVEAMAC